MNQHPFSMAQGEKPPRCIGGPEIPERRESDAQGSPDSKTFLGAFLAGLLPKEGSRESRRKTGAFSTGIPDPEQADGGPLSNRSKVLMVESGNRMMVRILNM